MNCRGGHGIVALSLLLGGLGTGFRPSPLLAAEDPRLVVEDPEGRLAELAAPMARALVLPPSLARAATEGRLGLADENADRTRGAPAQWEAPAKAGEAGTLWWLMSRGPSGQRRLILSEMPVMPAPVVQAQQGADGQVDLRQADQPVLKYIYQTNEPGNLLEKIRPGNRIYARARSDYIHPLYGLDGVELTKDWSVDHPHHRGIYWAWPEVDYHGQRGDLHALQRVFARPTGHLRLTEGPVLAIVDAENLWYWEDRDAIVRERVVIRVFRAESPGRLVDLEFYFTALKEGVTVARRGMAHYGGLNLRLSKVTNQVITFFTDPPGVEPRRAWSDLSGTFAGGKAPAGLAVFPHPANPAHPPEWIQYPDLNWAQPTFPAAGQRYPLSLTEPLVLRFRLWIHQGTKATDAAFGKQWKNYQELKSPRL